MDKNTLQGGAYGIINHSKSIRTIRTQTSDCSRLNLEQPLGQLRTKLYPHFALFVSVSRVRVIIISIITSKKVKKKTIFTIVVAIFILAVFNLPDFSFVPICFGKSRILDFIIPTSSGNEIGTSPVSTPVPAVRWTSIFSNLNLQLEKLTGNLSGFYFVSPTPVPAPTVNKSENDSGKIDLGLDRFFAGLNSRLNEFTNELVYSLSDSTYLVFSKATDGFKNLNFELAISQTTGPSVSGVKGSELKRVFSDQLKSLGALNPVPAVRNFLATANRVLGTHIWRIS